MRPVSDSNRHAERQHLFEELRQAYAQAASAASAGKASSFTGQSAFVVESRKAADIVARIRALDAL